MTITWDVPEPREGVAGFWDRFIGPGASRAEIAVQLAGTLAVGLCAFALYIGRFGLSDGLPIVAVVLLLCFDLGGGVATNSTGAAKRWYHRKGQGWRQHLGFVAVHGVHIGFVAFFWAPEPIGYFALAYGLLLVLATAIALTPLHVQRPVAFIGYTLALLAAQQPWFEIGGFAWFLPLLYLKLLICHLVVEAPFSGERP